MQAKTPFDAKHPDALAMYCSDGRFTEAIEELLHGLGHARLDTLTVPGGPALLDLTSSNLGAVDVMREAATFLIRGHRIKRVVLLGHEGCGYYRARFPYESPDAMRRRQLDDIRQAARWVSANHEELTVTSYFATPEDERLRFDEI
jgi:hypothetical protein